MEGSFKRCSSCAEVKLETEFNWKRRARGERQGMCRLCSRGYQNRHRAKPEIRERNRLYAAEPSIRARRKERHRTDPRVGMLRGVRHRAKKLGIPFDLEASDLVIPEFCPALGARLEVGDGRLGPNSPSLDRTIPELGYVKGNVTVISVRANTIKHNATAAEIQRVADYVRRITTEES